MAPDDTFIYSMATREARGVEVGEVEGEGTTFAASTDAMGVLRARVPSRDGVGVHTR